MHHLQRNQPQVVGIARLCVSRQLRELASHTCNLICRSTSPHPQIVWKPEQVSIPVVLPKQDVAGKDIDVILRDRAVQLREMGVCDPQELEQILLDHATRYIETVRTKIVTDAQRKAAKVRGNELQTQL